MLTVQPTLPVEIETRKQVLVYQSETGVRRAVRKSKAFRFYTLEFHGRKRDEYESFEPTWVANYPGTTIEWVNTVLNATGHFYFDSALRWSPTLHNLLDYSFILKRRDAQAVVAPVDSDLPYSPSYTYEVNPQKETKASDSVSFARISDALGDTKRLFTLGFHARSLTEVLAMEQFWDYHYPCRQISFTEPVLDFEGDCWIDSNFKWRVNAANLVEYSFAIREV